MRALVPLLWLGCFCVGAFPAAGVAAETEVVTVVARQIEEPLQRVPGSVSVLDSAQIDGQRLDNLPEIARRLPNFTVNDPFGRLNPAPAIRGLTQPGLGEEPTVATFVDGVYLAGRSSIDTLYFDLERAELYRGPQNALYGRNAFAGALNLISKTPSGDRARGEAQFTAGTKNRAEVRAAVEGPVVPGKLAARLAVLRHDFGGFYENATAGGSDIGRERTTGLKFTLNATPTERTQAIFRYTMGRDNDGQPDGFLVRTNCQPSTTNGSLRLFCDDVPEEPASGIFATDTAAKYVFVRRMHRFALDVRHEVSDSVTLQSISGTSMERQRFARDNDYSATVAALAGQTTRRFDYTQDLRVLWDEADLPVRGLFGVSLYRFGNKTVRENIEYALGQTSPLGGPQNNERTYSGAVYASGTWEFVPDWSVTADGRYLVERKTLVTSLNNQAGLPIGALGKTWTDFQPKLTLAWQTTPDVLLFTSAARGFKTGGFNTNPNIFDSERAYDPETNTTYEVGARTQWLGGRLTANLTGFFIKWQEQQVVAFSAAGATNNFFTDNAARSHSKGLELELAAQPLDGLEVNFGYGFADARFDEYSDPDLLTAPAFAPDGDVAGNRIARYPQHQLTFGALYEQPLTDLQDSAWFAGADAHWQSRQFFENSNLGSYGPDTKVNARLGGRFGALTLTLWAQNIFDDRSPPVAIRWFDPARANARAILVTPGEGRTLGITGKVEF